MGQNADFMPIDGWDHLELYVGNAKQAAYFYEHAFGFTPTAYGGPETGMRDRASYVLEQGEIRLVVTSRRRADSEGARSEEHTAELQSLAYLVCRLLLVKTNMPRRF